MNDLSAVRPGVVIRYNFICSVSLLLKSESKMSVMHTGTVALGKFLDSSLCRVWSV